MGTALSAATSRHHRRIETTSSDGPPGVTSHYRSLNERRPSRHACSDSSPVAAITTAKLADNRPRDRLPLKSPASKTSASPPPSPRTDSARQRNSKRSASSKFFSRFGLRNVRLSVTSKKATHKLDQCEECQECDSGCLQEETCFTIVDHQNKNKNRNSELQQPCSRRYRRPEPAKRTSCRSQQMPRVTAGNRFAASVVNRYRSLSSFFARSSSVIGPAAGDTLPTRVAYRDGAGTMSNEVTCGDRQSITKPQVVANRRPVSITIGPTAAFNDAFDSCCDANIANLSSIHGDVSTNDLLACLDEFVRARCRLSSVCSPATKQCRDSTTNGRRLGLFRRGLVTYWLKTVDQSLLATGWQDAAFVDPVSIVVVFALVRDTIDACCRQNEGKNDDSLQCRFGRNKNKNKNGSWFLVNSKNNKNSKENFTESTSNTMTFDTVDDLRVLIIACLYVSYAYVGSEISYPLKPFLFGINRRTRLTDDEGYRDELDEDEDDDDYDFPYDDDISYSDDDAYDASLDDLFATEWRHRFWSHCLATIERSSSSLLRLNNDSDFFIDVFDDLLAFRQPSSLSAGTAMMNEWRRPNGTRYHCEIQNTAWTSLLRRET